MRSAAAVLAAVSLSAGAVLVSAGTASAQPGLTPSAEGAGPYLALGDSVAFGYLPSNALPAFPQLRYYYPSTFVSYANDVASALDLSLTNASCPGETTASFINTKAVSNGCENSPVNGKLVSVGYRTLYPLHVTYTSSMESQLTYALDFLKANRNTKLVTIDIGANDAFACQALYGNECNLSAAIQGAVTNLASIYFAIRTEANYTGPIVLVNYYSLSYQSDSYGRTQQKLTNELNSALDLPNKDFNVLTADGYGAFQVASAAYGGNVCNAGLLVPVRPRTSYDVPGSPFNCNIHPSLKGHQVLADAIIQALQKAGDLGALTSVRGAA